MGKNPNRNERRTDENRERERAARKAEIASFVQEAVKIEVAKIDAAKNSESAHSGPPSQGQKGTDERTSDIPNITDKIVAGCTAGMLIVVIAQAYFNSRQVDEATNANKVATRAAKAAEDAIKIASDGAKSGDEQFKIIHRPYLIIESTAFKVLKEGEPVIAEGSFKNTGTTPGIRVRWTYDFGLSEPTDAQMAEIGKRARNQENSGAVGAGISPPLEAKSKFSVTKEMMDSIEGNTVSLYFYGVVTYESVWDKIAYHETTFCMTYKPNFPVVYRQGDPSAYKVGVATTNWNDVK